VRKVILVNNEIYHVFNRSIEQKPIFTEKREWDRALLTLDYYRFSDVFTSLSQLLQLEIDKRNFFLSQLKQKGRKLVEIISYCLMPNHYHLLLKQIRDNGIKEFISNFSNSYTRYFNIKHNRIGPIFQGYFKSVRIEDTEQLIHVCRYIHINPVVSAFIGKNELAEYPYSSFVEYLGKKNGFCDKEIILDYFSSIEKLKDFTFDQVDYGKKLERIKHLIHE